MQSSTSTVPEDGHIGMAIEVRLWTTHHDDSRIQIGTDAYNGNMYTAVLSTVAETMDTRTSVSVAMMTPMSFDAGE